MRTSPSAPGYNQCWWQPSTSINASFCLCRAGVHLRRGRTAGSERLQGVEHQGAELKVTSSSHTPHHTSHEQGWPNGANHGPHLLLLVCSCWSYTCSPLQATARVTRLTPCTAHKELQRAMLAGHSSCTTECLNTALGEPDSLAAFCKGRANQWGCLLCC